MARKKIVIYLRKSRNDNEYESVEETLSRHEKQLQEYAIRAFGSQIQEDNIYREVVSGETIEDRPVMEKLLKDIEKGEIEGVLVIEPQRLSRGSFGDIDRIVNTFKYTNTKIITPMKTYDLNNKFDKKFFEQELLRGNDYLEYVKEILVRGRIRSVEDGYYIGSITPYGYDKVKVNKKGYKLIPNKDAENVKYIFQCFINGMGTSVLSNHLNDMNIESKSGKKWTPEMTRNIITNEIYIGTITYGRREVKKTMVDGKIVKSRPWNTDEYIKAQGLHEPIIDNDVFDKAQELLKSTAGKNISGNKVIRNPLAGLIKCGVCEKNMIRKAYDTRRIPTLICRTYGCKCVGSDLCLVENRVIDILKKELANYKYYVANYEQENVKVENDYLKQIANIDKELIELDNDLKNALVKYNRNKITEQEYDYLKDYTTKEQYRLNGLKMALNEKIENNEVENKRKAIPILENCLNEYDSLDVKDKHELLCSIIEKITYTKTESSRWKPEADFELELFLKI